MAFHFPFFGFRFVHVFRFQCSMRVPIFQEEHFPCEPAISSSSVPYNTNPRPVHVARRIHGQRLKGDMVPYRNYNSNSGRGDGIATT
jgi:hypothetical protein